MSDEPAVDPTWEQRELRWLAQIDAANRRGDSWAPDELFADDEPTWQAAVYDWDALVQGGLVAVRSEQRNGSGRPQVIYGVSLTAKGRRAIGRWPSEATQAVDELLSRLDAMIEAAPHDQRAPLIKARDGLVGMGRDVLVAIAGGAGAHGLGFG